MNNNRKKWQGELRRSLEREAFNEKYECLVCGKKENLHIHHLIYAGDKEGFFNPKYWRILCESCHGQTPTKNRGRPRKIKKQVEPLRAMFCKNCNNIFTPKINEQKFCKRECQVKYGRKDWRNKHDETIFKKRLDKIEQQLENN